MMLLGTLYIADLSSNKMLTITDDFDSATLIFLFCHLIIRLELERRYDIFSMEPELLYFISHTINVKHPNAFIFYHTIHIYYYHATIIIIHISYLHTKRSICHVKLPKLWIASSNTKSYQHHTVNVPSKKQYYIYI